MTNLSGSYMVISRLWHCYAECNSGTQSTAVSCVSGTAGTRRITMQINCGLNEHHWRQGRKMSLNLLLFFRRKLFCPHCICSWASWKTFWKVWIKPTVDSNVSGISPQMWSKNQGRYIYRTPDQGTDARQTVRWRPEWDWKKCMVVF